MLSRLTRKLRALLHKRRLDCELDEELRHHLERQIDLNLAAGMGPEEERRAALRGFGGIGQAKEECRDARGVRLIEDTWQDLRFGARMLRKSPGFTLTAVLTLALGIGANTAIFSVVNAVLLRPLPYPAPERLVALRESKPPEQADSQIAPGNFLEWRRQANAFSQLAAYRTVSYNLTDEGEPERLRAGRATANLFATLGVEPRLGRGFTAEEDQPGRGKVVLLGDELWRRRFGADAGVLGKSIRLNGESYAVVGVLPAGFRLPDGRERELWTPIAFDANEQSLHHARYVEAIGRLKPDVTLAEARAEMDAVAARLAREYPEADEGWGVRLSPLLDFAVGDAKPVLRLLAGAVALVLLVACANVANLLLARAAARQREIAVRVALGAGRWRIVRQLLTESVLLAALGGAVGLLFARWGLGALVALAPADVPRLASVTVDSRALLFMLCAATLTGLCFGLAPAWRLSKPDLSRSLKGSGGVAGARSRLADLLVFSEIALALVLLVVGGLLGRTFWQLRRVDPGFDYRGAAAVTLQLPEKKYAAAERINSFGGDLLRRVSALPSVRSAALARILPIVHDMPTGFYVEGRARGRDNQLPQVNYSAVSPDYFRAMGIPVLRGRAFTDRDAQGSPRVAVVSRALAERFFPGEDPVGKRVNLTTGPEDFWEIVGVVGDVKQNGLERETRPQAYDPFAQAPDRFMTLVLRSDADAAALVPAVRREVFAVDPEQPVQRVSTLEAIVSDTLRQRRFTALLLSAFALTALALAAAGLYGLLSYTVARRAREFGVRMALGARGRDVMLLVLRRGMVLALAGIGVGAAASLALTRLLKAMLFGVRATDPVTFALASAGLVVTALVACYVPARRATKVDPLIALRAE